MAQVVADICLRSSRKMASPVNLTANQFTILRVLASGDEFQVGDLARLLDISNAATSKNVSRLVKLGLVSRKARPADRRSLDIVLLGEGRKIIRDFNRILGEKQEHLMEQFSTEEKKVLLGLVQKVINYTVGEEQDTDLICLQCGGHCGESCVIESCNGLCVMQGKK
jgi:DNA-binding MarR family transcriptional regulator